MNKREFYIETPLDNCFEAPIRIYSGEKYGVVLHKKTNVESYATHEFRCDDPSNFYWGHYFDNKQDAKKDFAERVLVML